MTFQGSNYMKVTIGTLAFGIALAGCSAAGSTSSPDPQAGTPTARNLPVTVRPPSHAGLQAPGPASAPSNAWDPVSQAAAPVQDDTQPVENTVTTLYANLANGSVLLSSLPQLVAGPNLDSKAGFIAAYNPTYHRIDLRDSLGTTVNVAIEPFRVLPGEAASCLNLYEPTSPRILGLPHPFTDAGPFSFPASRAASPDARANPWPPLAAPPPARHHPASRRHPPALSTHPRA